MNNIVIIPKDKIKVLTSGGCFPANGYFTFYKEDVKVEQVPTNWEELKELCIATNYIQDILKKNKEGRSIPVYLNSYGTEYIIIKDLYFGENGIVFFVVIGQRYIIAKDLTFAQMYQIIKNLIGEE